MWNAIEIGVLGKDHEPVPDSGRCNPRVHRAGAASRSSSVRNDRGETAGHFSIDRDSVESALNPAESAKAARPGRTIFGT